MTWLSKIEFHKFPENQYVRKASVKFQLVFHFTVSGKGAKGDIDWWLSDPKRIATCMIVDYKGIPHQLFNMKYYASHLGIKEWVFKKYLGDDYLLHYPHAVNSSLDEGSIGIELDSWGPLLERNGHWHPIKEENGKMVPNLDIKSIPKENIVFFDTPFRGFNAFEKFTDKQLETAREIVQYCNMMYNIPKGYNEDMWDVSPKALKGTKGIWTHVSFRPDKDDCMPQPEFIQMLKTA